MVEERVAEAHEVVVAGGGPTGLVLAAELAIAGVDVVVVERRSAQELDGSRAGGLHARTLEVLDQRGVADRFLTAGTAMQIQAFAQVPLPIEDLVSRHPHGLALWQAEIERLLAAWVEELGVPILRGRHVVGVAQDEQGVDVALDDADGPAALRAAYLVGCDGGRSTVRKAVGIGFTGTDPTTSWLLAECSMADEPPVGMRPEGGGIGPRDRERGGNPYGVVLVEPEVGEDREPTFEEVRGALVAAYGSDFGAHSPTWITRFTDATRQATASRDRRVLLAGDAAHIHPPQGGQGLNLGVQDAVNLGWKLAQVVQGISPDALLDSYHAERHPVAAGVIRTVLAQVALSGTDPQHLAARAVVADLLALDEARRRLGGELAGLTIRYVHAAGGGAAEGGDVHPLVGWRVPDVDLETADGPTRVAALLHEARPVLLDLRPGARRTASLPPVGPRVRVVPATADGPWRLPLGEQVPAPEAILVRPDGHVAWAGDPSDPALPRTLATWFGTDPAPTRAG